MICPACCKGKHKKCIDEKKSDTRLYRSCPCLHKTLDPKVATKPKLGESVEG